MADVKKKKSVLEQLDELEKKYKHQPDGYREVYHDKKGVEMIYNVPCPLPRLPKDETEILNYDKPVEDQKWQRLPIPDDVQELCEEMEIAQDEAQDKRTSVAKAAFDREIALSIKLFAHPFVQQELKRKIKGVWIYIKGTPYWLSGHNYIYLQYWNLTNTEEVEYRDRDRRWFTFWNLCEKDPNCYGIVYMKHRQEGATSRVCCSNVNYTSSGKKRVSGMVSKGKLDAQKAFRIKLLQPYFELPLFLRPATIENTTESNSLRYIRKTVHAGMRKASREQSLNSAMDFKAETVGAYDGETIHRIHADEAAKWSIDLDEFWIVHQPTISQGSGSKITGKAQFTSTVGLIDESNPAMAFKAGAAWRSLWKKSDFWDRNKNGKTQSGLYRLFLSAEDGLAEHIDEYGFSMRESAREYILNHVQSLKSRKDRISYKRTHPITEADALTPDNPICHFDIDILKEQYHRLEDENDNPDSVFFKNNYIRGNFRWKGKRMDVSEGAYFDADETGNWLVFNEDVRNLNGEHSKFNRSKFVKNSMIKNSLTGLDEQVKQYEPTGVDYVIGFDPYKVEKTTRKESRGSNAAAVVFMRHNPQDSEGGFRPVAYYLGRGYSNEEKNRREQKIDDTHDNILAGAFFFSAKILYENETQDFLHFCNKCGALDYLHQTPASLMKKIPKVGEENKEEEQKGISGKWGSKEKGVRLAQDFVDGGGAEKIPFVELIVDMIGFDINNSTKFDLTIAFLLALVAAYEPPKVYKSAKIDMGIFERFK